MNLGRSGEGEHATSRNQRFGEESEGLKSGKKSRQADKQVKSVKVGGEQGSVQCYVRSSSILFEQ